MADPELLSQLAGRGTMGGDEARSQQPIQGPQHWDKPSAQWRIGDMADPVSSLLVQLMRMAGMPAQPPQRMQPRAGMGYGADADLSEFMHGLKDNKDQYLNMGPDRYR